MRFLFASVAAIGMSVLGTVQSVAQTPQPPVSPQRSLEGDWIRTDQSGSGDFGGLTSKFAPAVLTPAAAALVEANRRNQVPRGPAFTENRAHDTGDPYIVVDRPCGGVFGGGALGINPDSGAIHFVEQKDEIIMAPERGGARHIYMDGRKHPDLSRWTPTASGHAVGHYENGELVVDTMGLSTGAVTAGGWRTPETHLTEHFDVSSDGRRLTIKYRWEDPKLYQKPHEYQYTFDRLPDGSYAFEEWCDASDPIERQSVVPPKQLP